MMPYYFQEIALSQYFDTLFLGLCTAIYFTFIVRRLNAIQHHFNVDLEDTFLDKWVRRIRSWDK